MLNVLWGSLILVSLGFGVLNGRVFAASQQMLNAAARAISLSVQLAAGYAFFGGVMEILSSVRGDAAIARLLRPVLRRCFPTLTRPDTQNAIAMNLSANLLGLGNAATPYGLAAMRLMQRDEQPAERLTDAMCLFLVINSTSLQLLPTTVLTMRTALDSDTPFAIIVPTLAATLISTVFGVTACVIWIRIRNKVWKKQARC